MACLLTGARCLTVMWIRPVGRHTNRTQGVCRGASRRNGKSNRWFIPHYLESSALGISRSSAEVIDVMRRYGESGLTLVGHSRGAMTIGNAMEALEAEPGSRGSLLDTDIKFVGPAYSAQEAANRLDRLSDGFSSGVELQNHADDFVGTLIGKNPATYDSRHPKGTKLQEWINIFTEPPTVHSCYGTGAADKGCISAYGKAPTMKVQSERQTQDVQ